MSSSETLKQDQNSPQIPLESSNDKQEESKLSLADIFKEPESEDSNDSDAEIPEDVNKLAKRLKIDVEKIYAIKVPMKNNEEPVTIGTLKDRISELVDLDTRELKFDQRRVKQEGELLRAQNEMREILALLPPDSIKPELLTKLRSQRENLLTHEHQKTLEMIPEWQTESDRVADMTGMIAHLSEYGFPESFLSTVTDHRALKYIRDNYRRDKRIKEALAKVKTEQKTGVKPSGKQSSAQRSVLQNVKQRVKGTPDNRARIMDFLNNSEK